MSAMDLMFLDPIFAHADPTWWVPNQQLKSAPVLSDQTPPLSTAGSCHRRMHSHCAGRWRRHRYLLPQGRSYFPLKPLSQVRVTTTHTLFSGRSLGEVTKYLVYNMRKRQEGGDQVQIITNKIIQSTHSAGTNSLLNIGI
jgi:hypothetical protein